MAEFRFDIRPLFTQPIIKVTSNLLPHTFRGDRKQSLDATSKMSEIIDRLGQLSANAQKLNKPVTTAQRLRMSENQIIYMMADVNDGINGKVLGLLKIGNKDLYLFDESGETRKVSNAPSILDFYIHESRQRSGLGKELFETMLSDEGWVPVKCSIDRPSEKLLAFFKKHYGLVRVIPQANNFVLYEGFFDKENDQQQEQSVQKHQRRNNTNVVHTTSGPNTQLFGATFMSNNNENDQKRRLRTSEEGTDTITAQMAQITQFSPAGRYGARRPTCSMAEKTASEVSMTPSQLAELEKQNAKRHPLDALSKGTPKLTIERRSGLQDVDEDYLKKNVFAKPIYYRNSGLNDNTGITNQLHNLPAAGQPSIPHKHDDTASLKSQNQFDHISHHQQQQQPGQMQNALGATGMGAGYHMQYNQSPNVNHIIHNGPATTKGKNPQSGSVSPITATTSIDSKNNLSKNIQSIAISSLSDEKNTKAEFRDNDEQEKLVDVKPTNGIVDYTSENLTINHEGTSHEFAKADGITGSTPSNQSLLTVVSSLNDGVQLNSEITRESSPILRKPPTFQLSKQHTGMKNRSDGVGMAVTPSNKMEFMRENHEDFGVLKIQRPVGHKFALPSPSIPVITSTPSLNNNNNNENNDDVSSLSSKEEGALTQQGYYDMKFFHNKLW